eukprot:2054142-Amphidinium_carterae.1
MRAVIADCRNLDQCCSVGNLAAVGPKRLPRWGAVQAADPSWSSLGAQLYVLNFPEARRSVVRSQSLKKLVDFSSGRL